MVDDNGVGRHQQWSKTVWNFRELHTRTFENLKIDIVYQVNTMATAAAAAVIVTVHGNDNDDDNDNADDDDYADKLKMLSETCSRYLSQLMNSRSLGSCSL